MAGTQLISEAEYAAGRILSNGVKRRRHKKRIELNEARRKQGYDEIPLNTKAKWGFTIVCNGCGHIGCGMGTWHNDFGDGGTFIKCDNCGQNERY